MFHQFFLENLRDSVSLHLKLRVEFYFILIILFYWGNSSSPDFSSLSPTYFIFFTDRYLRFTKRKNDTLTDTRLSQNSFVNHYTCAWRQKDFTVYPPKGHRKRPFLSFHLYISITLRLFFLTLSLPLYYVATFLSLSLLQFPSLSIFHNVTNFYFLF